MTCCNILSCVMFITTTTIIIIIIIIIITLLTVTMIITYLHIYKIRIKIPIYINFKMLLHCLTINNDIKTNLPCHFIFKNTEKKIKLHL